MQRLIKFALVFAGSAIFLKASSFLLSIWIARILIPELYGVWGLAYAIQVGISTFGIVGIQEALVGLLKEYPHPPDRQRLYGAVIVAFFITMTLTQIVAIYPMELILPQEKISSIGYIGIIVSGALSAFTTLQTQLSRLEEDHQSSLNFSFIIPFAGVLGSALTFFVYQSVDAFFIGSSIGMMIFTIILRRRIIGLYLPTKQIWHVTGRIIHRLSPFILVAFLGWLSGYGGSFFVDGFFGLETVGKLTFLLSVGSILQLLASSLNQVWSPRFYNLIQLQQDIDIIELHNRRFYSITSLGLGGVAAIFIAGMPYVLHYVGGSLLAYMNMKIELLLIFAGYIVLLPWTQCQNYLLIFGLGKTLMNIALITSVAGLIVWIMLMKLFGPFGIYLGFFIQMIIRTICIASSAKKWKVRPIWGATISGILIASSGLLFPSI